MASVINANGTLQYTNAQGVTKTLNVPAFVGAGTTVKVEVVEQTINTTETAISLGGIAAPGWSMFVNLDPTNYIDLKVATGGALFARLDPDTNGDGSGGFALLRLSSGAQAPYAIANSGACLMAAMIVSQ